MNRVRKFYADWPIFAVWSGICFVAGVVSTLIVDLHVF
jgi:hypothetical protein